MKPFTDYLVREGRTNKPLVLQDGSTISVQCSSFTYCTPREDNLPLWAYTEFEVWFEGIDKCPEFEEYCAPDDVATYVPKEVIQNFIDSRGGILPLGEEVWEEEGTPPPFLPYLLLVATLHAKGDMKRRILKALQEQGVEDAPELLEEPSEAMVDFLLSRWEISLDGSPCQMDEDML